MIPVELCLDLGEDLAPRTKDTFFTPTGGKKTVGDLFKMFRPEDVAKMSHSLLSDGRCGVCAFECEMDVDKPKTTFVVRAEKTTPNPEKIDVHEVTATFYSDIPGAKEVRMSLMDDIHELGVSLFDFIDDSGKDTARLVFTLTKHAIFKDRDFCSLEDPTLEYVLADLPPVPYLPGEAALHGYPSTIDMSPLGAHARSASIAMSSLGNTYNSLGFTANPFMNDATLGGPLQPPEGQGNRVVRINLRLRAETVQSPTAAIDTDVAMDDDGEFQEPKSGTEAHGPGTLPSGAGSFAGSIAGLSGAVPIGPAEMNALKADLETISIASTSKNGASAVAKVGNELGSASGLEPVADAMQAWAPSKFSLGSDNESRIGDDGYVDVDVTMDDVDENKEPKSGTEAHDPGTMPSGPGSFAGLFGANDLDTFSIAGVSKDGASTLAMLHDELGLGNGAVSLANVKDLWAQTNSARPSKFSLGPDHESRDDSSEPSSNNGFGFNASGDVNLNAAPPLAVAHPSSNFKSHLGSNPKLQSIFPCPNSIRRSDRLKEVLPPKNGDIVLVYRDDGSYAFSFAHGDLIGLEHAANLPKWRNSPRNIMDLVGTLEKKARILVLDMSEGMYLNVEKTKSNEIYRIMKEACDTWEKTHAKIGAQNKKTRRAKRCGNGRQLEQTDE